jgi:hypothetical protein
VSLREINGDFVEGARRIERAARLVLIFLWRRPLAMRADAQDFGAFLWEPKLKEIHLEEPPKAYRDGH